MRRVLLHQAVCRALLERITAAVCADVTLECLAAEIIAAGILVPAALCLIAEHISTVCKARVVTLVFLVLRVHITGCLQV